MNLEAERLNRGLTLRGAAKQMGITPSILFRAENGARPRPGGAKAIADFYGVAVTDLWPIEHREPITTERS